MQKEALVTCSCCNISDFVWRNWQTSQPQNLKARVVLYGRPQAARFHTAYRRLLKLSEREVDQSSKSSTEVKNDWSSTSSPTYTFVAWIGTALPFTFTAEVRSQTLVPSRKFRAERPLTFLFSYRLTIALYTTLIRQHIEALWISTVHDPWGKPRTVQDGDTTYRMC
jgi:hypothetical protein